MEINGEPARGISHTRAIELIQGGGNKVILLLRPGAGLAQDCSKYCLSMASMSTKVLPISTLSNYTVFIGYHGICVHHLPVKCETIL